MKYFFQKYKYFFLLFNFILLSACSSIPSNTADGCSIFNERYLWYKHAKKAEAKWGTPVYLQLAIIKMESSFDRLDRKSTRLNSSHSQQSRMPSSA